MRKPTETRLRKQLKKLSKPHSGWTDVFPAIMGRSDGTVLTSIPGMVWVRNILSGQTLAVHNSTAPIVPLLQVEVGKRVDQPGLWQVKGTMEPFSTPSTGGPVVNNHHERHEFPAGDTVWVDRKQIKHLTVLVSNAAGFVVKLLGGIMLTANGITKIATQTVDLSSYVPTEGAVFVSIESDDDGAITINEGTGFAAPTIATVDDIPSPAAGKYTRAYVLLYEGQSALSNNDIVVPMPPDYNPLAGGFNLQAAIHGLGTATPTLLDELVSLDESSAFALYKLTYQDVYDLIFATLEADVDFADMVQTFLADSGYVTSTTGASEDGEIVSFFGTGGQTIQRTSINIAALTSGWIAMTDTWTRTGNHTFTVSGNVTSTYRKGTKVRYKDGGAFEYGTVLSSSHAAGTTTVNLMVNSDFAMAAATITDTSISYMEGPDGFPNAFNFTLANPTGSGSGGPMTVTITATTYAKFRVTGSCIDVETQFTVTTSGTGSTQINVDLPVAAVDTNSYPITTACVDGGTGQVGTGAANGNTGKLLARKQDNSVWGIGTGRIIQLNGEYPY